MPYRIVAVPPTPEAGAALTDAWGAPAVSATWDAAAGLVTVVVDGAGVPLTWPGSTDDPAGTWRAVEMSGPTPPGQPA